MTRRLKSRNRKYAGDRTHGGGNKKNRRGKGSRGGRGRAGYHKHKWMHTIKYELHDLYMKHKGFHNVATRAVKIMTLDQINSLVELGKVEKKGNSYTVSLPHHKVLATGALFYPVEVTALTFSAWAVKKIQKAGGKAISLFAGETELPEMPKAGGKQ